MFQKTIWQCSTVIDILNGYFLGFITGLTIYTQLRYGLCTGHIWAAIFGPIGCSFVIWWVNIGLNLPEAMEYYPIYMKRWPITTLMCLSRPIMGLVIAATLAAVDITHNISMLPIIICPFFAGEFIWRSLRELQLTAQAALDQDLY